MANTDFPYDFGHRQPSLEAEAYFGAYVNERTRLAYRGVELAFRTRGYEPSGASEAQILMEGRCLTRLVLPRDETVLPALRTFDVPEDTAPRERQLTEDLFGRTLGNILVPYDKRELPQRQAISIPFESHHMQLERVYAGIRGDWRKDRVIEAPRGFFDRILDRLEHVAANAGGYR